MDKNVLVMDENRIFAGPAGTPSGAAAACRNLYRSLNVLISESAGNPGISGVRSLWKRNAGYGKKASVMENKRPLWKESDLYGK